MLSIVILCSQESFNLVMRPLLPQPTTYESVTGPINDTTNTTHHTIQFFPTGEVLLLTFSSKATYTMTVCENLVRGNLIKR